jgi:hypothetical protein
LSGSGGDLASIDTANALEGIISKDDIANWKTMSNDQRRRAVLNGAMNSGRFTASERNEMISAYVTKRVQEIVDTDNLNTEASGLADAGELVNYINSLGLNEQDRQKAMESICRGMSFRIEGDQINWYGSVKGAEATIGGTSKRITDAHLLSTLGSSNQKGEMKVVGEKIYQCRYESQSKSYYWVELTTSNIKITGDGHTNTSEQTNGIYELLVYMLDPNTGKVTPGGDSTSENFITDGNQGGGRTKDFSTTNK